MGGSTTILFQGCTLSRLVTKRWKVFHKSYPTCPLKKETMSIGKYIFQPFFSEENASTKPSYLVDALVDGFHSSKVATALLNEGELKAAVIQAGRISKQTTQSPNKGETWRWRLSWLSFFLVEKFSGKEIISEFIERELDGIEICQHKTILAPDLLSLAKKLQANLATVDVCVLQQSVLFDHVFLLAASPTGVYHIY